MRVRDAGVGLPAADLGGVFDLFVQVDTGWQRTQGGMGIGQSLVKQLVEALGGRVEARSAGPGTGSEFVVRLPCLAAGEGGAADGESAGAAGPSGSRCRVLVVDDNCDAADSLAELLEALGHETRAAYGGAQAVAAAADFRPRHVLMDLGMPGCDGLEAARRIRAAPRGCEPLLVAMTGWGSVEDLRRTREAGFDRHLVKPVGSPNSSNRLPRHCACRGRSDSSRRLAKSPGGMSRQLLTRSDDDDRRGGVKSRRGDVAIADIDSPARREGAPWRSPEGEYVTEA